MSRFWVNSCKLCRPQSLPWSGLVCLKVWQTNPVAQVAVDKIHHHPQHVSDKLTTPATESQASHAKPVLQVRRVLDPSSSSPWSVRGVDWLSSTCSTVFRWPKQHRQFCSACSMRWSTGAPHQSNSGWPGARGDHSVHLLTTSTTFSPVGSRSSHGMRMCMRACVCVYTGTVQNELSREYANTNHNSSSFHLHTHTHEHPHNFSYHLRTAQWLR